MSQQPEFLIAQVALIASTLKLQLTGVPEELRAGASKQYEMAVARLEQLADSDPFRRLDLSPTERVALWTLVALTVDPFVREFVAKISGGRGTTTSALRDLVYGVTPSIAAVNELGPSGALTRLLLTERTDAASDDQQVWSVSRRALAWAHGDITIDPELRHVVRVGAPIAKPLEFDREARAQLARAAIGDDSMVIVSGQPGTGKRQLLLEAAAQRGHRVLEIEATKLATDPSAFEKQLRTIARECRLHGCLPLLCNVQSLVEERSSSRLDSVAHVLAVEIVGPVLLTSGLARPALRWGRSVVAVEMKPLNSAMRAKVWLEQLGQGTQEDAEYLATQYPLAPALIGFAARAAKASANGRKIEPEDIYGGIRAVLDDKLGDYAKRVAITQSWDDLVLGDDQLEALQYLIARIRQRRTVYEQWGFADKVGKGLGTSALFSGPPGTGKTMVAALLARELGLELYQVDMAKITSKYIGETERNLAALFDAAEAGHAILLFDEADSLFGKRTDVKSSNDRYANLETNYLLQRLETFTGICLLTSNHESNIDIAFQRRLSLHLRFELPEADERAALWQAMLPSGAPIDTSVDFASLARRFAMSGGYIRNAVLRAAFLAADESSPITGKHLERAARLEYQGMGRIAA